jgi:hypothetical protein
MIAKIGNKLYEYLEVFIPFVIVALSAFLLIFLATMLFILLAGAAPLPQDPGQQVDVFSGSTITTTAQTATTACGQGSGSVGRKTLSVINDAGSDGAITVTAELRATSAVSNHTSGHMAVNGLAAASASSDTTTPDEAAGRFCQISAVSASTSTITVTMRRE